MRQDPDQELSRGRSPPASRLLRYAAPIAVIIGLPVASLFAIGVLHSPQEELEIAHASDLPPRSLPAVAVVGKKLFVFGGQQATLNPRQNNGALVDARSGAARLVPDAPFDSPLEVPTAVAVGDKVVVEGTTCPSAEDEIGCVGGSPHAAVFHSDSRSWSRLPIPDELKQLGGAKGVGATSDGRAVFAFSGDGRSEYWTVRVDTYEWARIEDPPGRIDSACLLDDQLVIATTMVGRDDGKARPTLALLDLDDPSPRWRRTEGDRTATHPLGPKAAVCLGQADGPGAVMLLERGSGQRNLRMYDLATDQWSQPPPAPADVFSTAQVWTGEELIFIPAIREFTKPGLAYAPSTQSWRVLPDLPALDRNAFWNRTEIVAYGEPVPIPDAARQQGLSSKVGRGVLSFSP